MKAKYVNEALGIFKPKGVFKSKTLEQGKEDIKRMFAEFANKIPKEEFENYILENPRNKRYTEGNNSVILTNDVDVLDTIKFFIGEFEQDNLWDIIHQAEQHDKEVMKLWMDQISTGKEYGFSEDETIKHRDVEDFLMIDIILDPFIDKFKLEW